MRVIRGTLVELDGLYTDNAGNLVDPVNPRVDLLDALDVQVATDLVPVRVDVGTFHLSWPVPDDGTLGSWRARWTGTINGVAVEDEEAFDVVLAGAPILGAPLYGASIDDVRALVADWTPRAGIRPTEGDVDRWLVEFSGRVGRRLGDLTGLDVDQLAQVEAAARGIVSLGVASRLVAARTPAKAGKNETSYDAELWKWYQDGLDELVVAIEELRTTDPDVVGAQAAGGPQFTFPTPTFGQPSLTGPHVPGASPLLLARLTDPHRY